MWKEVKHLVVHSEHVKITSGLFQGEVKTWKSKYFKNFFLWMCDASSSAVLRNDRCCLKGLFLQTGLRFFVIVKLYC